MERNEVIKPKIPPMPVITVVSSLADKEQRISNIAALAMSRINYVFIFDLDSHRFGKSSF